MQAPDSPLQSEAGRPGQLGVGVVGLQEGRTLLIALTHTVPDAVETGTYLPPGAEAPPGARRAPHARAIAACDLDLARIAATRQVCPDLSFTKSYPALLARDDIAIVAIYTPDHLHADHIIAAFEAGKHVICTKPLVTTIEDARRVLTAGRRTGRKLLVGQSTRFFEPFLRQRAAYERGAIGALEFVDAHYLHRMNWYYTRSPWLATETDWAFQGLSHPVDLVRWYLGPIAEVSALATCSALGQRAGVASFDLYSVNLRAVDGRIARVLGHYGLHELPSARNAIELVLYGTDGTSQAQYHDMRYRSTSADGAEVTEDWLYQRRGYYFNNEIHGMHYGEFGNYAEYFAQALLEGRDYSPGLEEGIATFCVLEAIRQSAQTRQPVPVDPLLEAVGL